MRERGLARRFERHVERAAKRARDRGLDVHGDLARRRDLTGLATFTIDPASARDFDDAISAEALDSGAVRVWVHIADVSAYVPVDSPVDVEARKRATSVYVPGAVEPMLPRALSNDACSLVPCSDRLAVTVELELRGARGRERLLLPLGDSLRRAAGLRAGRSHLRRRGLGRRTLGRRAARRPRRRRRSGSGPGAGRCARRRLRGAGVRL